jgi:predicted small lipoprotein YifL
VGRAGLLATIALTGMLGACGQKGPLYLPKPGATPPVASKPVPSPAASAADPATDSSVGRPLR